ncbi:hypothetical protein HZA33_02550 [Candidatus Pacearchaeota archaeon]|nr:hypothetical protein [Candidatus Pacearchaeota archaeon]
MEKQKIRYPFNHPTPWNILSGWEYPTASPNWIEAVEFGLVVLKDEEFSEKEIREAELGKGAFIRTKPEIKSFKIFSDYDSNLIEKEERLAKIAFEQELIDSNLSPTQKSLELLKLEKITRLAGPLYKSAESHYDKYAIPRKSLKAFNLATGRPVLITDGEGYGPREPSKKDFLTHMSVNLFHNILDSIIYESSREEKARTLSNQLINLSLDSEEKLYIPFIAAASALYDFAKK